MGWASLALVLVCLTACGFEDAEDDCGAAACTDLGTKPANKSQTFCGKQGTSGGVSGDAEKWQWSADTGTCSCEIQLSQTYWKNCAFTGSSSSAPDSTDSTDPTSSSSLSAQEAQ